MATIEPPRKEIMEIVRHSAEHMSPRAAELATLMYDKYYAKHPDWMRLWSADFRKKKPSTESGGVPLTLMAKVQSSVVFGCMKNLACMDRMEADLKRVSMKHCSRHVDPCMYPDLGLSLIEAILEVYPETDSEIINAWVECYTYVSQVLIDMEKNLYTQELETENGFVGFKEFRIVSKTEIDMEKDEDDDDEDEDKDKNKDKAKDKHELVGSIGMNTIVEFAPVDGSALPKYIPEQYVCLRADTEKLGGVTHRNYTLYGPSNEKTFSLNLNRLDSSVVTECLLDELRVGDVVCLSAPFGEFLLMESLVD
mmetsp:Transcript_12081/g.20641  ORF Transcript_12081/g.20641 Transcript_12081/m.20641 type:complete len:309 (-) Transcript_12081:81-1007(-)|eukprot:CAMPEP_0184691206 /NCGR_PEP_ID=MMETSP0313-20130426/109_1 /TAXON_ID=2792 /ORGANISM="Porphyridium aerugineum, Strain SAG 1380-2" /LENGTH=308 /DNA_ID=CAMNT_0027148883 /DNA_START=376 /DNA_END=1302 /DNA_ORIENTATION=-